MSKVKTRKYIVGKGYVTEPEKIEPEDYEARFKLNIALFDMKTIQSMVDECKPHAGASEFQIHYHSIQAHMRNGNNEVIITIPLAFYNFDQEVSSGSVSMEMKDVNKESEKCIELLQPQIGELFEKMPVLKHLSALGYEVDFTTSDNGSIHRHPGDFSFSSIDYDKDPDEPGVIYRQSKAKDLYQTDSVIYLGGLEPKFVCTETRIVNVEPVEDNGGIKGRYTEIPTFSFILKDDTNINTLLEMLGDTHEDEDILDSYKQTSSMNFLIKEYPLLIEILKAFKESGYLPDTRNVIGKRIEQEPSRYSYKQYGAYQYGKPSTNNAAGFVKDDIEKKTKEDSSHSKNISENSWNEYEDWSDYVDDMYPMQGTSNTEEEEKEIYTCVMMGVEHYYCEEWASWLPMKCKDMEEQELIQYLDENELA